MTGSAKYLLGRLRSGPAAIPPDDGTGADGSWIAPRRPLILSGHGRQTISCDSGVVWITQGDGEDYVLMAGEKLTLAARDTVIVSAMANPALIRRSHAAGKRLQRRIDPVGVSLLRLRVGYAGSAR